MYSVVYHEQVVSVTIIISHLQVIYQVNLNHTIEYQVECNEGVILKDKTIKRQHRKNIDGKVMGVGN